MCSDSKFCRKCNRNLPADTIHFHRDKTTKDGLYTVCKECKGRKFGETMKMSKPQEIVDGCLTCNKCNKKLPAIDYYFFRGKRLKHGFHVTCKVCQGYTYGEGRGRKAEYKEVDSVVHKKCTKCDTFYPHNNVYFHRHKKYGLQSYCKQCSIKMRLDNIKTESGRLKHRMKEARRRSRIRDAVSTLTERDWNDALSNWADEHGNVYCPYCDLIVLNPQQDHVIPVSVGGGYERSNIIPAGGVDECACNQSKNDEDLNEFFMFKETFTKELYLKIKEYLVSNGSEYKFLF